MTSDFEARIRRLEDRALISERVIAYAVAVDRRDWEMFAACFTDPVYVHYSANRGAPGRDMPRAELVDNVRGVLDGFTVTQHLSPNHVIEFDHDDADRAVCHSYMYAQHHLEGSPNGDFFLLRGTYTAHLLRTPDGWRIERLIQYVTWPEGNQNAVAEARGRVGASATERS